MSRRGHGDNIASMAWGARNLISTQFVTSRHSSKTGRYGMPRRQITTPTHVSCVVRNAPHLRARTMSTRGGTRTRNLRLRRATPCPLGHESFNRRRRDAGPRRVGLARERAAQEARVAVRLLPLVADAAVEQQHHACAPRGPGRLASIRRGACVVRPSYKCLVSCIT